LWAFVAAAGATGDALAGALAMAVFWSGTLPVMASLGAGVQALAGPLRRHLPKVTAATLILVGAVTIAARSMNPIVWTSPPPSAVGLRAAARSVESIDHDSLSCCTDDHPDRAN
jgi:sulfite exporter TauE/SafE